MTVIRILSVGATAILALLAWFAWPIYGFYAHQGEAPFPPWGWLELPAETPVQQELLDPKFRDAGDTVLGAMEVHRRKTGAPAMSAAVAVDGKVVWRGAVGWADIQSRQPATPETIFRVGSTSKAITATALARLVDNGTMDLDTPISDYFTNLPNPEWAPITPRMLASHMAGVPHYGDNKDSWGFYETGALRRHYGKVRDAVAVFDESPLLFEPGTEFKYSSLGTVLLGAVMGEASGGSYRSLVKDEVLKPADLTSTIVAPKRAGGNPNLAQFYYHEKNRYRVWRPVDLSHRLPGGGWASTSTDLVRIGSLWLDETYISGETRKAFWTPQRLSSGDINEQNYAVGWRWREWDVEPVGLARNANHGGVSRGAQSWLLVFPDYDMAVAFNINANTEEFREFGIFYQQIVREFALAIRQDTPVLLQNN